MGGAKSKEAHKLYKEEDGSHMGYVLYFYLVCGLFRLLAFFNCLVEIAVLFSTGCFRARIPNLSLRGLLEEFVLHLHTQALGQATTFFISAISAEYCAVLQGAVVENYIGCLQS